MLVTGATGFVGARVAAALVEEGHDVRAMTRRPDSYDGPGTPVAGDVSDPASLVKALDGADAAYYFVHSLGSHDFVRADAEAARAFAVAAAQTGVQQIIYLGGLGSEDAELSPHLRSRREVEGLLAGTGVPVTVLRAAIVVGHGGISWEMTRQLVDNLPLMATPPWVDTRTQPIAVTDVVRYLVAVLGREEAVGRTFEVGGADVLTYGEMMQRAASIQNGRDVPIVKVPMLSDRMTRAVTTELSSYWLSLFTDADRMTGRNLVQSMSTEVVVGDESIRSVVPFEPMGYDAMVREALAERLREVGTL